MNPQNAKQEQEGAHTPLPKSVRLVRTHPNKETRDDSTALCAALAVGDCSGISRSKYTPPVGSQVRFSTCGTIATVTAHTARGFTYKDGPVLSIPRLGILGTGEGECFTDVPGWDTYVIRFKPDVTADCPNNPVRDAAQPRSL